jgi:hypothetical protein
MTGAIPGGLRELERGGHGRAELARLTRALLRQAAHRHTQGAV